MSSTKTTSDPEEYLTEKDLARLVKRDTRSLRRWHEARIGPPRISFNKKLILYRRSAVEAWLLEHESGNNTSKAR